MHVLFVIDPLPTLKAYKDSSVAMMRALEARGHTLSVAYQEGLYIDEGVVMAVSTGIGLAQGADLHEHAWWFERAAPCEIRLAEFDAVVMRKDPPFDMEYVRSEEHTSELQSLMRISYAVFCLKKKQNNNA